jgi:arylsulfatase A-like enzyme
VPFIARWPGRIPANRVSAQLTNTTDIFATVASVIGFELPDEVAVDSFDMLGVMLGIQKEADSVRPHMVTQSFRGEYQLRMGNWKLLDHTGSGGNNYEKGVLQQYQLPETAPKSPGQLFDLAKDPGETNNLYATAIDRQKVMHSHLTKLTAREGGRTAPRSRKPMGIENIPLLEKR